MLTKLIVVYCLTFFVLSLPLRQSCRHAVLAVCFPCGISLLRSIQKKKCPPDYWLVNINTDASFVLFLSNLE